jgi:hypothetical protein
MHLDSLARQPRWTRQRQTKPPSQNETTTKSTTNAHNNESTAQNETATESSTAINNESTTNETNATKSNDGEPTIETVTKLTGPYPDQETAEQERKEQETAEQDTAAMQKRPHRPKESLVLDSNKSNSDK